MNLNIKSIVKTVLNRMNYSRILMYHHVTDSPEYKRSGCIISQDRFFESIAAYSDYTDIYTAVRYHRKGYTAVTFDDGLIDVYTIAYPYLKERNIPFTIFIVTDFLNQPGYLTREQLIELAKDPLVTIGGHGKTHEILKGMPFAQQEEEIIAATKELEVITGRSVDLFAYSHGQYDKTTLQIVKRFRYAFTAGGGNLNFIKKSNLFALPRIGID